MDELKSPLRDDDARRRIHTELDANLLVEAGAGSGKTTALVGRMVALVRDAGARPEQIAAVTFTRKAASELRERFQDALEAELAKARAEEAGAAEEAEPHADVVARLDRALREVDRTFVGTIHSFCSRLLRERPLEAGLDPAFRETLEDEEARLSRRFWGLHLERLAAEGDASLEKLDRVGLAPDDLRELFDRMSSYEDVDFELEEVPPPDPARETVVRQEMDRILDRAERLFPEEWHEKGPDPVQKRLRQALFQRRVLDLDRQRDLFEVLGELCGKKYNCTYSRWAEGSKDAVKALESDLNDFFGEGGRAWELLEEWWAYRYPHAVRFARRAAEEYREHRRRAGWLNFGDLLQITARLLRREPDVRRELGRRYRHLLVDEFQDTDPVQAEVALLLASDPEEGDAWAEATPRPGALFVVGDPKQSIYRFRRADIAIYDFVRRRFEEFGDVVELTTNFRSVRAIEEVVNDVFRGGEEGFAEAPTPHQARFAPLNTVSEGADLPRQGVFHYDLEPDRKRKDDVARDDAERLAAWIQRRVGGEGADRRPRDFLILTWDTTRLEHYARALEARNLPVQVSGAGVSAEDELGELLLLLRALADPDDDVLTVAVLVGMFFGLDPERLLQHREEGGRFSFRRVDPEAGEEAVREALERMGAWWETSRRQPCDVLVGAVVEELGLVPHAAADELGSMRAGALLYGLDAVRGVALEGDTSVAGAVEALEAALGARQAEAPLEPGRSDSVRVMNLHKAKGLEAPVVVLACPIKAYDPDPDFHVERGAGGETAGWTLVQESAGFGRMRTLAQPPDWQEKADRERLFADAETVRKRYVAATRAEDELVVARHRDKDAVSPWACFHEWLDEHGTLLELPAEPPPPRERLEASAGEIMADVERVEAERLRRGRPSYRFQTVTQRAKGGGGGEAEGAAEVEAGVESEGAGEAEDAAMVEGAEELGAAAEQEGAAEPDRAAPPEADAPLQGDLFGTAAGAAAGMAAGGAGGEAGGSAGENDTPVSHFEEEGSGGDGGEALSGEDEVPLEQNDTPVSHFEEETLHRGADWGSAVHATLEAAGRGADEALLRAVARSHLLEHERPVDEGGEPVELERLLETVGSVLASELWVRARGAEQVLTEVPFALPLGEEQGEGEEEAVPTVLDGQVDLAFREEGGWVLVDYKTDLEPEPSRVRAYRRQLEAYAEAWGDVTGEPVAERLIFWTRRGEVEGV